MIAKFLIGTSLIYLSTLSLLAHSHSPETGCEALLQQFPLVRLLTQALMDGKISPKQIEKMVESDQPLNPLRAQTKTPDNLSLSLGVDRQLRTLDQAKWQDLRAALATLLANQRPDLEQKTAAREDTRGVVQLKQLMKHPIFGAFNNPYWHHQNGETYLTIPVQGKTEVLHFPDQKLHVRYIDNPFLSSPLIAEDGTPLFTYYSKKKARLMNGVSGETVAGPRKTGTWPVKARNQDLFEVSLGGSLWSKQLVFEARPLNGKWFRPVLRQKLPAEFQSASIKAIHNTPTESWIEITGTYKGFAFQSIWEFDGAAFHQIRFFIWSESFMPSLIHEGRVYLALASHGQSDSHDIYVFGPEGLKGLKTSKPIASLLRDENGAPVARLFGEGEKFGQRSGDMFFSRLTPTEAGTEESVHVGLVGQDPGKPIGMIKYRGESTLVLHTEGVLRFVGVKTSQEMARVSIAPRSDVILHIEPDGRILVVTFPYKAHDDQYIYELIELPVEN